MQLKVEITNTEYGSVKFTTIWNDPEDGNRDYTTF